jgi:hypothetical protein
MIQMIDLFFGMCFFCKELRPLTRTAWTSGSSFFLKKTLPPEMVMDGHEFEGTNIEEPPCLTGYGTFFFHGKSW